MTPLPKKKHAKSRSRTRKAAIKYSLPVLITCANCNALKLSHRVCLNCGYYGPQKTEKTASK